MGKCKKFLSVMMAVLMLCSVLPMASLTTAEETELIQNGDFETGTAANWNVYQSTAISADAAKDGNYGMFLSGNGGWGGMMNQTVSGLEVGKTYCIRLDYMAVNGGVNIKLCAGTNDTGEVYAYTYGTNTAWTEFAVQFTATQNTAFLTFIGSGTGVAEKMYVDNISLAKLSAAGGEEDEYFKPISSLISGMKQQGRNTMVGETLMLDWTLSSVEFDLNCSGDVYATFNAAKLSSTSATGGVYFTILVDGVAKARDYCHITQVGYTKIALAEGLSSGKHTFQIIRQSEHFQGEVGLSGLSFDGTIGTKPAEKDLFIEFIGDSITCAYGNLGNSATPSGDAGSAKYADPTQGYAYYTAKEMDADYSAVSWSGIGCKYGYGSFSMQEVYPLRRYNYDKTTAYNFATRQPEIVVLALGTNDNSIQTNSALKRAGLVEMLTLTREKNPEAQIVWIHGMMTSGVSTMIEEIVAEFGGADAGYFACELTTNSSGAGYHPSAAGQRVFANELVAYLNESVIPHIKAEAADLLTGGETSRMENADIGLGLAFRFKLAAAGVTVENTNQAVLTNATVDALNDGNQYKLVRFGAVMSNDTYIGLREDRFTLDSVDGVKTLDVSAKYLLNWDASSATYAVRIINIPQTASAAMIYARPYYVYEDAEGEEVVVYDQVFSANYDGEYEFNDGVLEW